MERGRVFSLTEKGVELAKKLYDVEQELKRMEDNNLSFTSSDDEDMDDDEEEEEEEELPKKKRKKRKRKRKKPVKRNSSLSIHNDPIYTDPIYINSDEDEEEEEEEEERSNNNNPNYNSSVVRPPRLPPRPTNTGPVTPNLPTPEINSSQHHQFNYYTGDISSDDDDDDDDEKLTGKKRKREHNEPPTTNNKYEPKKKFQKANLRYVLDSVHFITKENNQSEKKNDAATVFLNDDDGKTTKSRRVMFLVHIDTGDFEEYFSEEDPPLPDTSELIFPSGFTLEDNTQHGSQFIFFGWVFDDFCPDSSETLKLQWVKHIEDQSVKYRFPVDQEEESETDEENQENNSQSSPQQPPPPPPPPSQQPKQPQQRRKRRRRRRRDDDDSDEVDDEDEEEEEERRIHWKDFIGENPDYRTFKKRKLLKQKKLERKISQINSRYEIVLLVDKNERQNTNRVKHKQFVKNLSKQLIEKKLGGSCSCESRKLGLGDFVWIARSKEQIGGIKKEVVLSYIVERKTGDDLASSLVDGRYDEQKFRLLMSGMKTIFYLIEGGFKNQTQEHTTLERACIHILSNQIIQVKRTTGSRLTIDWLVAVTEMIRNQIIENDGELTDDMRYQFNEKNLNESMNEETIRMYMKHEITLEEFNNEWTKNRNLMHKEIFGKMLLVLFNMSHHKAEAIIDEFRTLPNLIDQYYRDDLSKREKKELLTNLIYEDGKSRRKIGQRVSHQLFDLFSRKDDDNNRRR